MKHLFQLSLLLLALLLPATALAHDFYVNGIYYNINGNEATVTYRGSNPSMYDEYTSDVSIPSTVTYNGTTYPVSSIGDKAFHSCSSLTSITIPNSVITIGNYAFYNCSGLTSVNFGNSVTSIGSHAFYECSGLTEITIPNSVTTIGDRAFYNCSGLTNISIGNSVTSIGNYAFYHCTGLTSIIVAGSNPKYDSRGNCNAIIETASNTLFLGCMNTVIPNSVTTIGDWAFSDCTGLTSINIPNSITSIGYSAFVGCSSLSSITIPNSVTTIGDRAFYNCSGLTSIDIPNSVTTIGNNAFVGCSRLTRVTIGYSVTSIAWNAFSGCSGITDLIWNARDCSTMGMPTSNIERVTVGNEVEILPNSFVSGSKITSVNIPNSVTTIGDRAFSGCSNLTSITVAGNNSKFDSRGNCNAIIETASNTLILGCMNTVIPNSITTIGNYAFYGCTGLTSIDIPNSVTTIGDYAFERCTSLTSVTIGNSVTIIGNDAFVDCTGLTCVTIGNSVTSIGDGAFASCRCLANITVDPDNPKYDSRNSCNAIIETTSNTLILGCINTEIPNSVTSIGDGAFSGYSGLTSINIPNSVVSIGNFAFADCSSLTSIIIPNSVTSIGDGAFYRCTGLTSIDIPNSVTHIGLMAFFDCIGLTSVSIGNSVTHIGFDAFYIENSSVTRVDISDIAAWCNIEFEGCEANPLYCCGRLYLNGSEITELNIPNSVTAINNYAFYGCSALTSIDIPNSVITIGNYAFEGCTGLTSVTIGNSVTSIGEWAFEGCWDLTEIYCMALTPPSVSSDTFISCYGATLYVPNIALEAYKATDYWKDFTNIVGMPYTFEVDGKSYHATTMSTVSVMANNNDGSLYNGDIVIPDSVIYEGYTFAVTGIEGNAFDGCYELTSITIPNSVETIGEQAFQGCTGLKSVTIGSGVTAIGAKAFNYCNALETVKCLGTVPPVMASTDCFTTTAYNRATLLVPRNTEATYTATNYWYKFAHIEGWGTAGQGDVNGDGVMSILDVTSLIDVLLGHELDSFYFDSADLNSNGRLDIGDVTSLIDNLLNGDY